MIEQPIPKACVTCNNFSIDLGDQGYSEATPGRGGYLECYKSSQPECPWDDYNSDSSQVDIKPLVTIGEKCPYWELHVDLRRKE